LDSLGITASGDYMLYKALSISEFRKKINRNVYCFGAGRAFDFFMEEFAGFKLEKDIKAVVDNASGTMNSSVKMVNGTVIPIISLNQMLSDIEKNDCIVITASAYEEIIEQLNKIEKLNITEYYIYFIMKIEQYDYDRLQIRVPLQLSMYKEIKIPKIIHYCWFGKKEIPDRYKKWMESWKYYCPDYEIIEWNENNYDVHKSNYISQAYETKNWAFVSDYARIDIVNEYGGVYLDTDVELIKNIDVLLMNDAFCGFESCKYVAYGLGFGAKSCNSILREIKEYYDNMDFISRDGTLNQITCPVIQTEIMKKYGLVCNGEFQLINGMVVYPSRILCGMSPHTFRVERTPIHTYAIHHYAASWVGKHPRKNNLISTMKKWGRNDRYIYNDG